MHNWEKDTIRALPRDVLLNGIKRYVNCFEILSINILTETLATLLRSSPGALKRTPTFAGCAGADPYIPLLI
ncbi:MAG TPA: hypothetical protein VKR42_14500 [Ktedonobacteraceae bacterium]|nr:hypothetical protein [Ktedonobacteraceae bacterium]